MKQLVAIIGLCLALPCQAGPEEDLAAFRDFYAKRFPDVELAEEPEKDSGDHNAVVFRRLLLKTNA